MTARELNTLLEKYNLGHVILEKPYEGDNEIYARVEGISGDKWHFSTIEINDSTFGFTTENDICDDDYDYFEICDLQFYHLAWAYPRAYIDECGGGIDVAESNCGIRLTDYKMFKNKDSEIDLYTEQAIKMFIDPLKYQNWLLKMFLDEQTLFIEKHYEMLKKLGYWMKYSDIYKRGFAHEYTSKVYLTFATVTHMCDLYVHQNLFTGKFVFNHNECELDINDVSTEELEKILLERFEHNGEMYWRNERNKRLQ